MFQRKPNSSTRTSADTDHDESSSTTTLTRRSGPPKKRQHPDKIQQQQHLDQPNSVIKIIDIQRTPKRADGSILSASSRRSQQREDEEEERRSGTVSAGRSSLPPTEHSAGAGQVEVSGSNRCTPSIQQPRASGSQQQQQQRNQNQKQPSGETLSSFESDYDLLVYLGETETEDIVDTERSLDYQDQTWRQSICGGASLAPTIDGSLNELSALVGSSSSPYARDFDLLNTPLGDIGTSQRQDSPNLNQPQTRVTRKSPNSGLRGPNNSNLKSPSVSHRTNSDTECDREVTLAFGELKDRLPARSVQDSPAADLLRSRTLGRGNRDQQQQQQLQRQTRTMDRPQTGGSRLSSEAAELDRLLAEMSQSLDLDALARYDTGVAGASHQPKTGSRLKSEPTTKLNEASNESILDEYDGASRILEQMIADQLGSSPKAFATTSKSSLPRQQPTQIPATRHQLQRDPSQSSAATSRDSPKSVISAFKLQQRPPQQNTIEVQVESSQVGSHEGVSRVSSEVNRQDLPAPPPPPPPPKDYDVIKLEADEPSSTSEEEEGNSVRQYQVSPAPGDSGEVRLEPLSDRVKRRTLSSMRSMRHKFSDLMSEAGRRASRSTQGRASTPASRAASVGRQGEPDALESKELRTVQQRESRAPRRRQETPGNSSFGQQLRERLSRSKSRVSKWLLKGSRWQQESRAQSQPNTRQLEPAEGDEEDDGRLLQFQPGDIARNSTPQALSSPDSFNRSLDRHLARDVERRAATKELVVSGSSSDVSSQLSGLDITAPAVKPARLSRSRSVRQTGAPVAGAPNGEQEKRANSLISLKRLSASFRSNSRAKRQDETQDLDEMQVKVSDSIKQVPELAPGERGSGGAAVTAVVRRRRHRRGKRKSAMGAIESASTVSQSQSSSSSLNSPRVLEHPKSPMLTTDQYLAQRSQSTTGETDDGVKAQKNPHTHENTHARAQLAATEPNSFRPKSACAQLAPTAIAQESNDAKEMNQMKPTTLLEPVGPAALPFRPNLATSTPPHRGHQHVSSPRAVLDELRHRCSGLFGQQQQPQRPPRKRAPRSKSAGPSAQAKSSSMLESFAQQLKHSAASVFQPPGAGRKLDQSRRLPTTTTTTTMPKPADLVEWRPVIEVKSRNQRQPSNYSGKLSIKRKAAQ